MNQNKKTIPNKVQAVYFVHSKYPIENSVTRNKVMNSKPTTKRDSDEFAHGIETT